MFTVNQRSCRPRKGNGTAEDAEQNRFPLQRVLQGETRTHPTDILTLRVCALSPLSGSRRAGAQACWPRSPLRREQRPGAELFQNSEDSSAKTRIQREPEQAGHGRILTCGPARGRW